MQRTKSSSFRPLAAFVKYTTALSVKYVQSARMSLSSRAKRYMLQC